MQLAALSPRRGTRGVFFSPAEKGRKKKSILCFGILNLIPHAARSECVGEVTKNWAILVLRKFLIHILTISRLLGNFGN